MAGNTKNTKKSGLGRGLDAIFFDNLPDDIIADDKKVPSSLPLEQIRPGKNQPRKNFDPISLQQLADSIAQNGLIQPVVVRQKAEGDDCYYLIAGERRWRASKLAGLTEIPVIVLDIDDRRAAEISLIENLQREDLNAVEESMAYKTLVEDYHLTQEELSQRIGKSRSAVANAIRLLDLPQTVLSMIAAGELSAGHGKALLGLADKSKLEEGGQLVKERELSVRATEELVKKINTPKPEISAPKPDYLRYEKMLMSSISRPVKITDKKLSIEYKDTEDLETLISILCGKG